MLSWRAGVVFKPRPNGSIYAGLGTSFNPSAEGLTLSRHHRGRRPGGERAASRWARSGTSAGGRLSLTGALFRTEKTNARTPGHQPRRSAAPCCEGEQRVDGLEVGRHRAPRRTAWSLFAGYTFMDSEIEESNTPAEVGNAGRATPRALVQPVATLALPGGSSWAAACVRGRSYNRNTRTRCTAPGYWVLDATAAYRGQPSSSRCGSTPTTSPTRSTSTAWAAGTSCRGPAAP